MSITKNAFGLMPDGKQVDIFTLKNESGAFVQIINLGGIAVSINVPDKNGNLCDIVLGCDCIDEYLKQGPYLGAIIGRCSNRIKNGKATLNSTPLQFAVNNGDHHLHGGIVGFDKKFWNAQTVENADSDSLILTYTSADGEENYPGKLDVEVTYTFYQDNALEIHYKAISDKDTIVNLTNHSYFNLAGHNAGKMADHKLMINADYFTVVDSDCIPTGEIRPVDGTPMDLRTTITISDGLAHENTDDQLICGNGYDHNWVINGTAHVLTKAAELSEPTSGRVMEVITDKPGIQFYGGNFLNGSIIGKGGIAYQKRDAICLETQFYPDSINHPNWPSPILHAGKIYDYTTIYKFSVIRDNC